MTSAYLSPFAAFANAVVTNNCNFISFILRTTAVAVSLSVVDLDVSIISFEAAVFAVSFSDSVVAADFIVIAFDHLSVASIDFDAVITAYDPVSAASDGAFWQCGIFFFWPELFIL